MVESAGVREASLLGILSFNTRKMMTKEDRVLANQALRTCKFIAVLLGGCVMYAYGGEKAMGAFTGLLFLLFIFM